MRAASNVTHPLAAASDPRPMPEEEKGVEESLESQIMEIEKELAPGMAPTNKNSARPANHAPTAIGKSMSERAPAVEESKMGALAA